ncbi:MAG: bifunctional phosphopantothenoylcysteine decarboxylase/phosphopantothenate--cysteine ligase CoaBC [Bacteroidales bacterium]|nr:bifunctional phosphopantothenoylcysteine decarboxylase/phosphopantothenate--cysteine ligase CoaBC [Bacteroidales bacterium]
MRLQNKNIILGITGGIAAYKSAYLCRYLIKEGANVKVVMTPNATEFITPVTMATLSRNTVLIDFFKHDDGAWNSHVDLGLWADLMLIAPATASSMGKMAHAIADNLLITTYLSCKAPVMLAPSMDLDMFKHPSTQKNIETLKAYGNIIIEPTSGELASGLDGKGRMEEPETIVENVIAFFNQKKKLCGKQFLITAGPTYEKIDPVRFIGNFSSGKMGFAIADRLAEQGAKVFLVTGPTPIKTNHTSVERIDVLSADQMYEQCISIFPEVDAAIMAAAVADYKPQHSTNVKIKRKEAGDLQISLVPNKDIAASLGAVKRPSQILVGFALETNDELDNAQKKLLSKNLDWIVLNSLNDEGAGFGVDTNKITIVDNNNNIQYFELKTKQEVASDIVEKLIRTLK